MVTWLPLLRRAARYAPVVVQVGRKLDKQVRPHVLAYRLARDIDGYIARWTGSSDVAHWVVFADRDAAPLRAFPPLSADEVELAGRELDRRTLLHHSQLPEATVKRRAGDAAAAPGRVAGSLRRGVTRRRGQAGDDLNPGAGPDQEPGAGPAGEPGSPPDDDAGR